MSRRLVPMALLAAALAAASCGTKVENAPVAVVRRGHFERHLAVRGRLAAVETLNVGAETNGRVSFMAAEGTVVKAGDPLFGLDTKDKEDALQQVLLDLAVAQSAVLRAKEDIRIDKVKNALTVEEKTKQLDFNRLSSEIAKQDLEKKKRQIEKQILPKSELPAAELAVQQAELTVTNAQIDLERTNEEIASRTQTLQLDLASADARAQKAQSEVDEARDFISKATAKAPKDGVVIHAKSWRGTTIKVGDDVWQGMPVMELPDLSALQVEVQVNEVDVAQVSVGQAATITVDAYPDLKLAGSLSEISGVATEVKDSEGNGTGLRVFEAKVSLAQQDARLRPGMSARVELLLDSRDDVLLVPTGAVSLKDGKARVTLASGARRDVVVAASSSEDSVVSEGLSEGDRVLVAPSTQGAGGAAGESGASSPDAQVPSAAGQPAAPAGRAAPAPGAGPAGGGGRPSGGRPGGGGNRGPGGRSQRPGGGR